MRTHTTLETVSLVATVAMISGRANLSQPIIAPVALGFSATRRTKFNPFRMVTALVIHVSKNLKFTYNRHVPIGYEDEKGFHYGEQ